jgi:4-hydroxy-2-oxoheptanedioate aldolase
MVFAMAPAPAQQGRIYNTVKQKLARSEQVFSAFVDSADPVTYCNLARSGFDFLWIEMQHSSLTYSEVARMIRHCPDAPAIPFIRVPDATEGDILKATDIGALGILVPMVSTVEKAEAAVRFAKYPPDGVRSQGPGQARAMWGRDYRQTANDNMMVVAMIETPEGIAIADQIAAVEGVDVVFAAGGDIASFSGYTAKDPRYWELINKIRDDTLKAGKKLGGLFGWSGREGFSFFLGPGEAQVIRVGSRALLEAKKRE